MAGLIVSVGQEKLGDETRKYLEKLGVTADDLDCHSAFIHVPPDERAPIPDPSEN